MQHNDPPHWLNLCAGCERAPQGLTTDEHHDTTITDRRGWSTKGSGHNTWSSQKEKCEDPSSTPNLSKRELFGPPCTPSTPLSVSNHTKDTGRTPFSVGIAKSKLSDGVKENCN